MFVDDFESIALLTDFSEIRTAKSHRDLFIQEFYSHTPPEYRVSATLGRVVDHQKGDIYSMGWVLKGIAERKAPKVPTTLKLPTAEATEQQVILE